MSIQFCVAATLARGSIEESNYRLLSDPEIARLISVTRLQEGARFTQAYPGAQGSEVIVTLRDGRTMRRTLNDVVPATRDQIRARFRSAAGRNAQAIEETIERLDSIENAGELGPLLMR
jgi:2-methylcitrate dehydratase PrpD